MSYLDFLKLLLSLGPKLGQIMPLLLAAFDLFQQGIAKLGEIGKLITPPAGTPTTPAPAPVAMSVMDVNQVELETEQKVLALAKQHGGVHVSKLGDGTLLRGAWQFIQQHPELLSMLLGLLKGAAA